MTNVRDELEANKKNRLVKKLKKAGDIARSKAMKSKVPFKKLKIKPTACFFDGHEVQGAGKGNWNKFGFDIHPQVTVFSALFLTIFICLNLMFHDQAAEFFSSTLNYISTKAGWFFILSVNVIILGCLYFCFSRFGKIRLGGQKAKPEFSTRAWFSMLLSAGIGIGLMFWGVGEPISHFANPSPIFSGILPGSSEAAQAAMGVTFLHWGIHGWAIYSLVGLGLAFFSYNRGLPLTIRSVFYPLLGDRIYGFWGNLIDTLAVLATLAGLATSLGLGAKQVNAGLNALWGIEISAMVQVILIASITGIATISVVSGLERGIKYLSSLNMGLAIVFMLFVLIVGPTVFILSGFTQSVGFYFSNLIELSLWTETFKETNWQQSWTLFYWAWWISWGPFVGMFIARISKGRTVREFIIGVTLIPSLLSFIWLSVFGNAAIFLQMSGKADIVSAVKANVSTALFSVLEHFPLSSVLSFVALVLIVIFFVTSSDSGSLVVDHLTSGGKLDSPIPQRVFWAVMEGVIASILLIGGGLKTLQTATICTALPFTFILLMLIYSLYLGLSQELFVEDAVSKKLDEVEQDYMLEESIKEFHEDI